MFLYWRREQFMTDKLLSTGSCCEILIFGVPLNFFLYTNWEIFILCVPGKAKISCDWTTPWALNCAPGVRTPSLSPCGSSHLIVLADTWQWALGGHMNPGILNCSGHWRAPSPTQAVPVYFLPLCLVGRTIRKKPFECCLSFCDPKIKKDSILERKYVPKFCTTYNA